MRGILYSRRLYEKINPAAFMDEIAVMVRTESTNTLGELQYTYVEGQKVRALVAHRDMTEDDYNMDKTTIVNQQYISIITYYQIDGIVNPSNKIKWYSNEGIKILRIDSTFKAYGFYVRLRCLFEE